MEHSDVASHIVDKQEVRSSIAVNIRPTKIRAFMPFTFLDLEQWAKRSA
jgi:hypothetical protein